MRKKFILLTIIMITVINLHSQKIIDSSSKKRPIWIKEIPKGKIYKYYSGMFSSKHSLDEAKDFAISNAISGVILEYPFRADGQIINYYSESEYKKDTDLLTKITKEVKLKGSTALIAGLEKEEEYWECIQAKTDTEYRYWVLIKIPKKKYFNYDISQIDIKQTYGLIPIIKSAIIPGWGQIQKKETSKGIICFSLFAISLTSGFITDNISQNHEQDAKNSNNVEWRKYYNNLSDQYYLASIVSFIFSGAVYGYNIFDAISAQGAKIYSFNNKMHLQIAFYEKPSQIMLTLNRKF